MTCRIALKLSLTLGKTRFGSMVSSVSVQHTPPFFMMAKLTAVFSIRRIF